MLCINIMSMAKKSPDGLRVYVVFHVILDVFLYLLSLVVFRIVLVSKV